MAEYGETFFGVSIEDDWFWWYNVDVKEG
jgi:hypothetical protein